MQTQTAIDYAREMNVGVHFIRPVISEEGVTPEQAEKWLQASRSFTNRALRPRLVNQYASQMERGQWRMTGDPIRIDNLGRVLDGQHRLAAIIKADTPIVTAVMRNCPTDLANYVDVGTPRRAADFVRMSGSTISPNVTSGALNWLHRYRGKVMNGASYGLPRSEVAAAYAANPGIDESVSLALTMRDICGRSSLLAGAHYLFRTINHADADQFMIRVREGDNLAADDPEFQLRKRMLESRRGVNVRDTVVSAFVIKAWNARRQGRKVKKLQWKATEEFPEAI